jgi:pimeloyl-ACP methyl ester carboxylesterase
VVLVHGLAESIGMWDRMLPALVDRFRIVRVDLLGFGESGKPRSGYGIDQQARRVERVIRAADIAPVVMIGHSMGGDVAVALNPVAGAVAWRLLPASAFRRGLASAFAPGFAVPDAFVADAQRTTHAASSARRRRSTTI